MARPPFLFDAVLFDLDGTLVATDRFWVEAARAGSRRAFEELGLEHAMPSAQDWMSIVGLGAEEGFARLFPELPPGQRAVIRARCEAEEQDALRSGAAALLPGVEEALTALRARGAKLGIASNCGQDYLDAMLHGLGLARLVDEARCLDSPGVRSKAGMLADLLDAFGTRAAVMVGDRRGDLDAASENGLPHVHLARGYAPGGEEVPAEASIEGIDELLPCLERRAAWVGGALDRLGLDADGPVALGITGHSGSGKTLFARDCGRVLRARGRAAAVVALDGFLKGGLTGEDLTSTAFWAVDRPLEHLEQAFDLQALAGEVLGPHARGERVSLRRGAAAIEVPAGAVLVLEGLFLLHPRLRDSLARVIHLDVSEAQSLRRVAGRDARRLGPESLLRVRRHHLPTQRAFDEKVPPREHADLVLDAESALGPG